MKLVAIDRELERQRLLADTAAMRSRLDAELLDGRLDELAARGDALLLRAELERRGSPESAGL